MEFKKGDRVYHKNLQMIGTFIEYDWTGKEECHVLFDDEGNYDNCRHVTTSQLINANKKVAKTEYAVEVNNTKGFLRQVAIFKDYENAVAYTHACDEILAKDEYFNIIYIDYDENGDEVEFGSVV